jgi:hypothetical protein
MPTAVHPRSRADEISVGAVEPRNADGSDHIIEPRLAIGIFA